MRLRLLQPATGEIPVHELGEGAVILGRGPECDIVLPGTGVSTRHAVIRSAPQGWWIEDLGSTNGVLIGETRIDKAWLRPGDILQLGERVFVVEAAGGAPPPIPSPAVIPGKPRRGLGVGWWIGGCLGAFVLLTGTAWLAWGQLGTRLPAPSTERPTMTLPQAAGSAAPKVLGEGASSITIREVAGLPAPLPEGVEALSVHHVEGPVPPGGALLEFPYDTARLPADADPGAHLALAHLDPKAGRWILAAALVDPEHQVLRTRTRHLSAWAVIYHDLKWSIWPSKRFSIVYDPKETIVIHQAKGSAGTVAAKDFAQELGVMLDESLRRYHTAGFQLPEGDPEMGDRVWAFLGNTTSYWGPPAVESQWSAYSGNLLFPSSYDNREQAAHDAAHELFHKIQNLDLNIASMDLRRWWVEATADYAAARIALAQAGPSRTMGTAIKPRYLEKSITFTIPEDDGKQPQSFHDYATSHFIDFLVRQGVGFKGMWDAVADPSWGDTGQVLDPLDKHLRKTLGSTRGLDAQYQAFAKHYLFEAGSPMPALPRGFYMDVASARFELPAGQRTGRLEAQVEAHQAAQVLAVRTDAEASRPRRRIEVSLQPGSGQGLNLMAYKVLDQGGRRQATFLSAPLIKPAVAELAPGEMIIVVACNGTDRERPLKLNIKEQVDEALKPVTPPAKGSTSRRIEICVYAQCLYDRSYQNLKYADWPARRWESFELRYNSGGFPVSGAGTFKGYAKGTNPEDAYEEIIEGQADKTKLHYLRWTSFRGDSNREQRWEINLKDIPVDAFATQSRPGMTIYLIRVIDEDGKRFPNVQQHATIRKHDVFFKDERVSVRLTDVDWGGIFLGNPGATSPKNQRPFILVRLTD